MTLSPHRMKKDKFSPRQAASDRPQTDPVDTHRVSQPTYLSPRQALHGSYLGGDLVHQWAHGKSEKQRVTMEIVFTNNPNHTLASVQAQEHNTCLVPIYG